MILECEGYKMFRGVMRIIPSKNSGISPFELEATWLYKPEYNCWYGKGYSYCDDICEIVEVY